MIGFTKSEIRKLMFVVDQRLNYAREIIEDVADEYTELEKACAISEGQYMIRLHEKLNSILELDAKRVEVKRG